jgi:hypothetical protein
MMPITNPRRIMGAREIIGWVRFGFFADAVFPSHPIDQEPNLGGVTPGSATATHFPVTVRGFGLMPLGLVRENPLVIVLHFSELIHPCLDEALSAAARNGWGIPGTRMWRPDHPMSAAPGTGPLCGRAPCLLSFFDSLSTLSRRFFPTALLRLV